MNGVINCIMIVALLIARFALDKFMDTTSVKVRFGIGIHNVTLQYCLGFSGGKYGVYIILGY